jgi:hypothetical protein
VKRLTFVLCLIFLAACSPSMSVATPAARVDIYATSAAGPWLNKAFTCAAQQSLTLNVVSDPATATIALQIGEPDALTTPAFQIDTEEILVVTNGQSPLQNLTVERVRDLFAGRGDPSAQVWVYASGDDSQQVFDQLVMNGRSVTSSARMAATPQEMSDTLNKESNAVGILPRHWKAGSVREIYSVGTVPVLAIVKAEPQGTVKALIACLQK